MALAGFGVLDGVTLSFSWRWSGDDADAAGVGVENSGSTPAMSSDGVMGVGGFVFWKFVIIFVGSVDFSVSEGRGAGVLREFFWGSDWAGSWDSLLLLMVWLLLLLFFSFFSSGWLVGGAGADIAVEKPDRTSFLDCHVIS